MHIAIIPMLVMLAGALMFALSSNAKVAELGRIMFAVGLFWVVALGGRTGLRL